MFHKYYRKKAQILGHKASLPFYDVFAPVVDVNTKISYLDTRDLIVSSFKTFSEELADFAKKAFDKRWIDAEPREGKGSYGLCVDIFPIKESRIMANFAGLSVLEKSISDVGFFIVDFYGRYNFEMKLYEKRKLGQLSVEELNELMVSCMIGAYGDSVDPKTIHPYMWMNKVGYYFAGEEFLNFPYSFGVLFSKGLYAEYIKKGEAFVSQYNKFLSATSKNNIVDVAKIMDIDVHSIEFWRNSLSLVKRDIQEFISRA
ncbi:hypothetical protein [Clostridium sp.]|uniref:hypothetical protein n=1 Tax=Clostridium sp. TaxID=1506 RepID=UPI003D6CCFD7